MREASARLSWRIVGTAGVILAGGYVLALSAEAVAHQTGLGASFVGAVLLGACTSLPEVSTVLAAVRMGRYALALGDVFGTNLFNVIILVLVDALHPGDPILQQAGPFAAFSALLAAAITAVFLIGLVERRDRTVGRMGLPAVCGGARRALRAASDQLSSTSGGRPQTRPAGILSLLPRAHLTMPTPPSLTLADLARPWMAGGAATSRAP